MKKIVISFSIILLLLPLSLKANPTWMTSFDDAVKMSKILNKPILVDFWADWCGPCKKMDMDVWNEEEILKLAENFVMVKVDTDSNQKIASKYNVNGIPNVMILDSWGNELYSSVGYKDKNQVAKFLKSFSLNLTAINQAMMILDKDENNALSNIRVALKFQDASLVLEKAPKKAFIKSSNQFLKIASKNLEDSETATLEKIELLRLLNKAYFISHKGVLKTLDKKFNKVDTSNNALFYFISYYCYKNLEEESDAQKMYDLLLNSENNTSYLNKIAYLSTNE